MVTLPEIGDRIEAHLRSAEEAGFTGYVCAEVWVCGNRLHLRYRIHCCGEAGTLTREQAVEYLAWLDAGNVGKHWECFHPIGERSGESGRPVVTKWQLLLTIC